MKRLLLACALAFAIVGLAGTVGTANAGTITNLTIWHAPTPNSDINSANQKALPGNTTLTSTTPLADGAATGAINFPGDPNNSTIGAFLATQVGGGTNTCDATCAGTTISLTNFQSVTLMRFTFSVSVPTYETVQHDDGVSLFLAGDSTTNLFAAADADPTVSASTETVLLAAGNYDLWYAESNALPALLVASEVPVPEPATMFLGGLGLIAFGYAARRRLFGR